MLVRNNPLVNYDELEGQLSKVRATVERELAEHQARRAALALSDLVLPLNGAPTRELKAAENAAELFSWQGAEFVQVAYLTFLKRHADPEGLASRLACLHRGDTPYSIALKLSFSAEGRQHQVVLPGFSPNKKNIVLQKLRQLPVLGTVLRYISAVKALPALRGEMQQRESVHGAHNAQLWQTLAQWQQELQGRHRQLQQQLESLSQENQQLRQQNDQLSRRLGDALSSDIDKKQGMDSKHSGGSKQGVGRESQGVRDAG